MAFKVRLFPGAPDYETLHVAKLTHFPLEPRDYKPYSQARICFADGSLHLQLLSFEAAPLPDSSMEAVFRLPSSRQPLVLAVRADQGFSAATGIGSAASPLPEQETLFRFFTGEDLQGVYWGANITILPSALERCSPGFLPVKDLVFTGNLYKLCENPHRPHYGSFYPADFSKPLDAPENLGEFVVIDY